MELLPLKDIIASIIKEFESASVAADVSREHWRQYYESSALLKEFAPSRIKITEVSISIPLAFAQVGKPRTHTPKLTSMQLLRLIPSTVPMEERIVLAEDTVNYLNNSRRMTFANKRFAQTVVDFISKRMSTVTNQDSDSTKAVAEMSANLDKLRSEFLSHVNVNTEREALFGYQTEELLKLEADRIVRFELKIALD